MRTGQFSAPQTVLGFYAGVLIILEAGLIGVLIILAAYSLDSLIPWTLGFAGLVLIALLGVVVTMNVIDPAKLQLGEVKGKDFLEHQQVTRGDSIAGEYVEPSPLGGIPGPSSAIPVEAKGDLSPDEDEESEN